MMFKLKCCRSFFVLFFLTYCINYFTCAIPQIFNEKYKFCEFNFGEKHPSVFPSKMWTLETRNAIVHFSFCKYPQNECRNQSSSCLIINRGSKIIDFGEFRTVDSDGYQLESHGTKCPNSNENYTLTVTLECSDTIKPKPILTEEDDCHFEITMMKPDCRPKCTDLIHGSYLIDIRKFPAKNIDIQSSDGKKFKLSICGWNRKCGSRETGSCEVHNNSYSPMATTESQSLSYNIDENELIARGRYKQGRVVRELQVILKCNWDTEMSNPVFRKVQIQGKKYHFELESSYGCVKLPQECSVTSFDNLIYNLSSIYSPNGWQVSGVPQATGNIKLNICGPLQFSNKNRCSDQYSQVCQIHGNNYVNRGSVLLPLKVQDDIIRAVFSSGSTCLENTTQSYSTIIEFKCSKHESGPVYKELNQCALILTWETPHACPVDYYKSQNCYIHDRLGMRNLQNLASQKDKVYSLSPDVELVYNLCRPVASNCDTFTNASFCLKNKRKGDTVIGWDNREVISDQGLLRMELTGRKCSNNRSIGGVTINFVCNYQEPPPQIIVIEDSCKFNVTIFTSLACVSQDKFEDCVYNHGDLKYDLTPLSQKDRNYVIGNGDVEYILNVCGPIVTGPGALCKPHAMSCVKNKSESNIKHRYISLGVVSRPKMLNNSIVIESTMGTFCEHFDYYKTLIYFECSQTKLQPVFLGKELCTYKFLWKTPEACPVKRNCVLGSKNENLLNLTDLEQKILQINLDNNTSYTFDICTDSYMKFYKINDTSNEHFLKRLLYFENKRPYLKLDLSRECAHENDIASINFEFKCGQRKEQYFEKTSFENCVLNMTVYTHIMCSTKKDSLYYNVDEKPQNIEPVTRVTAPVAQVTAPVAQVTAPVAQVTAPVTQVTAHVTQVTAQRKCVVISPSTGAEFDISSIKPTNVTYDKLNYYLINFDGNCTGFVCRNREEIVPKNACPGTFFDGENNVVKLAFMSDSPCSSKKGFFQLEVWLKCDEFKTIKKIDKDLCKLEIEYTQPEACKLFQKSPPKAAIVGGVIGGMAIIGISAFIGVFFYKKRLKSSSYLNLPLFPKTSVPIYTRDSTL